MIKNKIEQKTQNQFKGELDGRVGDKCNLCSTDRMETLLTFSTNRAAVYRPNSTRRTGNIWRDLACPQAVNKLNPPHAAHCI